jgi:hypothetical protein
MSEVLSLPQPRSAGNAWVREHRGFLRTFVGAALGILGFAIATTLFDVVQTAVAERTAAAEPVADFPVRELPPEWRWQPKGVEYEHMYRDKTSPRLDWIR